MHIMKKKILMVLLACCMAYGLAGCSGVEKKTEETQAEGSMPAEEAKKVLQEEGISTTDTEISADSEESTEPAAENTAEMEKEPKVEVEKYLTISDDKYKGISVTVSPKTEVTDEDVTDEILSEAASAGLYKETKEGTVEEGDTVNIDYIGKKDGVAFDGGTAKGQDLIIGSGQFIDGFEDGLVGKKVGDTVDLNLTFPENYPAEELAGQEVVFTVTINSIKEDPEITDDLIDQITSGEYKKVDDYESYLKEQLEAQSDAEYNREVYSSILMELVEMYPIREYPQDFIDYYVNNNMAQLQEQAQMETESVDDLVKAVYGMDTDQLKDYFKTNAQQLLQQRIILGVIAQKENITLKEEDFQETLKNYADSYGVTVEDLLSYYSEDDIRESELENKVMEFLAKEADITLEEETEADIEELTVETESEGDLILEEETGSESSETEESGN